MLDYLIINRENHIAFNHPIGWDLKIAIKHAWVGNNAFHALLYNEGMKILLPIDGSECSFSTLMWAASTFDRDKACYYLLYVVVPPPAMVGLDAARAVEYDLEAGHAVLKEFKARLEEKGCSVERAEVVTGNPAEEICAYAEAIQADQIVLGSHGKTGLNKLILGSVSVQVLEHCQCPVTVHREPTTK
jgi:nucleotide-binding universal stress UspA family protein